VVSLTGAEESLASTNGSSTEPANNVIPPPFPRLSDSYAFFPNTELWRQEKADADQARKGFPAEYWCVHDSYYDLSNFMWTHPGGTDFIRLTHGMDVTEVSTLLRSVLLAIFHCNMLTRNDLDDVSACNVLLVRQLFNIHHVDISRARRCLARYYKGKCNHSGRDYFNFSRKS